MGKEAGEISAQLEEAIAGEVETPSTEETVETSQETTTEESKTVPYSRFKEVIDQKNSLASEIGELQSNYRTANDSLAKMTQMLEAAKSDQDLIKQIQALANDPNMLPHVEAIDKKLRGIEEEIEETGEVSDKTLDSTRKVIERQQAELQAQVEEAQSDLLVQRADAIADKWLESLPEQYTEQDRQVIGELWAAKVDWNTVEQNPGALDDVLADTFQQTINSFGTPRGGLIDPEDTDSYEIELPETPEVTPEQEIAEIVGTKKYSSIDDKGNVEVSDADFAADLGKVLKIGNR